MRQILCYGDSNTYGLVPKENARYPWGIRWTSRLNEKLGLQQYRVIVSPIHLGEKVWEKSYDPEFSRESVDVSKGLADVYAEIARNEHLYFLDASDVAAPSDTDQEHLNEEGHAKLAEAIYEKVDDIFAEAA